jgi:hypothetical protein
VLDDIFYSMLGPFGRPFSTKNARKVIYDAAMKWLANGCNNDQPYVFPDPNEVALRTSRIQEPQKRENALAFWEVQRVHSWDTIYSFLQPLYKQIQTKYELMRSFDEYVCFKFNEYYSTVVLIESHLRESSFNGQVAKGKDDFALTRFSSKFGNQFDTSTMQGRIEYALSYLFLHPDQPLVGSS